MAGVDVVVVDDGLRGHLLLGAPLVARTGAELVQNEEIHRVLQ